MYLQRMFKLFVIVGVILVMTIPNTAVAQAQESDCVFIIGNVYKDQFLVSYYNVVTNDWWIYNEKGQVVARNLPNEVLIGYSAENQILALSFFSHTDGLSYMSIIDLRSGERYQFERSVLAESMSTNGQFVLFTDENGDVPGLYVYDTLEKSDIFIVGSVDAVISPYDDPVVGWKSDNSVVYRLENNSYFIYEPTSQQSGGPFTADEVRFSPVQISGHDFSGVDILYNVLWRQDFRSNGELLYTLFFGEAVAAQGLVELVLKDETDAALIILMSPSDPTFMRHSVFIYMGNIMYIEPTGISVINLEKARTGNIEIQVFEFGELPCAQSDLDPVVTQES